MATPETTIRQHNRPEQAPPAGFEWASRVVETAGNDVRNFTNEWFLRSTKEAKAARVAEMEILVPQKIAEAHEKTQIKDALRVTYDEAKLFLSNGGSDNAQGIANYLTRDGQRPSIATLERDLTKSLLARAKAGR